MQKTNRLQNEASPYLLQHQHNPVDWYAWGEEAFERARREEKPIFLSIGYSTCYWCHVMEKDSFEHQRVADALNTAFISIKVDREERPDVDHLYMDAIIGLTGHGGWPMSVFLTPEGEPFYGGTYFPQAQFLHLLSQIAHGWTHNREEVRKSAREIARFLRDMSVAERGAVSQGLSQGTIVQGLGTSPLLPEADLIALEERFSDLFDEEWGGFGRAPKFPPAAQIRLLLRLNQRAGGESKARQMAVLTLEKMACGGLFDHLSGGFHRYSTDGEWLVPHFEKMLYDNALLIPAYLEAWQVTKSPLFRSVAEESANYLLTEMRDKEGGFYSAQDAGDVGREGEYYVWREDELRSLLSEEEFHAVQRMYGTTPGGNFEHHTNILHLRTPADWEKREAPLLKSARTTLLDTRNKRKHPHRDEKILTGWNGLAITALARAAQALSNERYLTAAKECARFIQKALFCEGKLLRRYCQGEARIGAMLEDYAALIGGLLALYECDFEPEWFLWAEELQRAQDEIFWDAAEQSYYFAPEDSLLLLRQKELSDGAIPSANSLSALNLFKLFHLTGKSAYQERALQVLAGGLGAARRHPTAFSTLFMAFDLALGPTAELAVIAGEGEGFTPLQALRTHFLPHLTVAGSKTPTTTPPLLAERVALGGETTFYLCHDHRCLAPTTDAAQLAKHFNLPCSTT